MSDFDDDDADYEETNAVAPNATYELTIKGLPHEAIVEAVYQQLARRTEAKLTQEQNAKISSTIAQCVDAAVARVVETRLEAEINKLLDQGWEEHDSWGRRTGKKFTLADRVTEHLQAMVDSHGRGTGESYSGDRKQRIQWFIQRAVEGVFDRETKALLDEFRTKVRDQFSADMAAKVAAMMKEAIGLR